MSKMAIPEECPTCGPMDEGAVLYKCEVCGRDCCTECSDTCAKKNPVCNRCLEGGYEDGYRQGRDEWGSNEKHDFSKTTEQLYIYCWGNNPVRATFKGRRCRVVVRGKMNSCLIEFLDTGEQLNTSRNALRKVDD